MGGRLDVVVMSELLQYNRSRDTVMKHRVPTPNVVRSSGRGVDATQSVRSIVIVLGLDVGAGSHRLSQRGCIPATPCFVVAH